MHAPMKCCQRLQRALLQQPTLHVHPHNTIGFSPGRSSSSGRKRRQNTKPRASRRDLLLGGFAPCCCGCCKAKDGWYDRFFAYNIATGMQAYEEAVAPFKHELLQTARDREGPQRVLDVGIGAAPNLQYLTSSTGPKVEGLHVIGVDPNPYMFDYARGRAQAAGLPEDALDLTIGVAESLPFTDASFDTVICTLVLCSVPSVPAAVQEMRRVLKPGGRVLFIEHVIAPPDRRWMRLGQRLLNPLQQLLADGCHLDRNPMPAFQAAGFSELNSKCFDVPGMGPIAPHVSGVATL